MGCIQAAIAQLGERQTEDLKVPGSSPGGGILVDQSIGEVLETRLDEIAMLSMWNRRWPTVVSCDGRVVKAFDLKSNGFYPRRFESYSQRSSV